MRTIATIKMRFQFQVADPSLYRSEGTDVVPWILEWTEADGPSGERERRTRSKPRIFSFRGPAVTSGRLEFAVVSHTAAWERHHRGRALFAAYMVGALEPQSHGWEGGQDRRCVLVLLGRHRLSPSRTRGGHGHRVKELLGGLHLPEEGGRLLPGQEAPSLCEWPHMIPCACQRLSSGSTVWPSNP